MKKSQPVVLAAVVSAVLGVGAESAAAKGKSSKDAQIEALEQRLKQLEERLEKAEAKASQADVRTAQTDGVSPASGAKGREVADASAFKQLDQKVKVIERKLEVDKEVALENSKKTAKLEAGPEGVRFVSPEGDHVVRLRGALQTDVKAFIDDNQPVAGGQATGGINLPDSIQLRQARIWLEGTLFKHFDFKIMPDFGKNGGTLLQDAYLDNHYFSFASLNVGKQKTPLSLERLQGDSDGTFLERAYPTQLASNRDVGVMLHGTFAKPGYERVATTGPVDFKNFVSYQLGVFNGSGDNGAASNLGDTTTQDNKELDGRLWAAPFQHSGLEVLEGLGVGVAGSWSKPQKANILNNLTSANGQNTIVNYSTSVAQGSTRAGTTVANSTFTNYTGAVTANEDHYRVYPQLYWYYGPFGFIGEYALSSQGLLGTETVSQTRVATGKATTSVSRRFQARQDNRSWQALFSYVVTGEDNSFQGVRPRAPFDPLNGKWGALQLAARWSQLDIDSDTFKNYGGTAHPFYLVDPSKSVSRASSWALGANWYLNRNVLIRADYEQTYFSGGAGTIANIQSRDMEKVFSTRFQVSF